MMPFRLSEKVPGISAFTIIIGQDIDFINIIKEVKKDARLYLYELYKIDFRNPQLPSQSAPLEHFKAHYSNATSIAELNEPGTLVTHGWRKEAIQEYLYEFIDDKRGEGNKHKEWDCSRDCLWLRAAEVCRVD
jgi:hypothetical protein